MKLLIRYKELMDKANQSKDKETYFMYVSKAQKLLDNYSPEM